METEMSCGTVVAGRCGWDFDSRVTQGMAQGFSGTWLHVHLPVFTHKKEAY